MAAGHKIGGWKQQQPAEIIDVTAWARDELHPYHPFGARSKQVLVCPDPAPYGFLIPGHRYILKFSNPRAPSQLWSEIIAYRVGHLMKVPVPPAFLAIDAAEGPAALIEFFFGLPGDSEPSEFIHGGDYCVRYEPNYEREKGADHTVDLLLQIADGERTNGLTSDPVDVWGKYFLFDAFIGNTDRHQDNWGILWHGDRATGQFRGTFAPAFDNGTSLGYNIAEEDLPSYAQSQRLDRYVSRGRHHIRWARGDQRACGHIELIQRWFERFPGSGEALWGALQFNSMLLEATIQELQQYQVSVPFSENRSIFVLNLLRSRHEKLHKLIRGEVG